MTALLFSRLPAGTPLVEVDWSIRLMFSVPAGAALVVEVAFVSSAVDELTLVVVADVLASPIWVVSVGHVDVGVDEAEVAVETVEAAVVVPVGSVSDAKRHDALLRLYSNSSTVQILLRLSSSNVEVVKISFELMGDDT
jgi:hypothetical protein